MNLLLKNMDYVGIQEFVRFFGDENAVYKEIPNFLSEDCTPKENTINVPLFQIERIRNFQEF